jgi:hypothetical protein
MQLIPVGGRVKSASVGLDHLYAHSDAVKLHHHLKQLREKPIRPLLEAYFPANYSRLKQMMNGVGFYRSVLKTDQGMAGNFLPFLIDPKLPATDLSVRKLSNEHGIAIPEPHYAHTPQTIEQIQKTFFNLNFGQTDELITTLVNGKREALKGREPFFFIRPAVTDREIIFGQDIITKVTATVNSFLDDIKCLADDMETRFCGKASPAKLLYCQPDVFVLSDGNVSVEKVNCPDVGFFLNEIGKFPSTIFSSIQKIVNELGAAVGNHISQQMKTNQVALITRDEVLFHEEDLLEKNELEFLRKVLLSYGIKTRTYALSQVANISAGKKVLLLNIDYSRQGAEELLQRHSKGELDCYPNPFFQKACQKATGLKQVVIPKKNQHAFLQIASSQAKDDTALRNILKRLDLLLSKSGINSDILHADIGFEIVPIFRRSMHSWKQLARRIQRYDQIPAITLRAIPATPDNLLITSDTGPRLHTYRFMFIG